MIASTLRDAEAAGREAAHAKNDGQDRLAYLIEVAATDGRPGPAFDAFARGYRRGREEN